MLRAARPHFEWPDSETYVRRLMATNGAQRLSFLRACLSLRFGNSRFFGLRVAL